MATLLSEYKSLTSQIDDLIAKRKEIRQEIIENCKSGYEEGRLKLKLTKRAGNVNYKRIIEENGIEYEPDNYKGDDTYIIKILSSSK